MGRFDMAYRNMMLGARPRREIQYGGNALQLGFQQAPPPIGAGEALKEEAPPAQRADYGAMAEALSGTPTIESGNALEAIMAALEGGIRGRAARDERSAEELRSKNERADVLEATQAENRGAKAENEQVRAFIDTLPEDQRQAAWLDRGGAAAAAQAPISRSDQATLDLSRERLAQDQAQFNTQTATTRRGQDLDFAGRRPASVELNPREDARITAAITARDQATQTQNLAREWLTLNGRTATGPGEGVRNLGGLLSRDWQRLQQLNDMLTPAQREAGSGTMSDADREMYSRSTLNPGVSGAVNGPAALAMIEAAQNRIDYATFLDEYSSGGSLQGSEQSWGEYLSRNPIYTNDGQVRENRPSFEEWLNLGAPDMRGSASSNSDTSREAFERERDRRLSGAPATDPLPAQPRFPRNPRGVRGGG